MVITGKDYVDREGCHFAVERLSAAIKNFDVIICGEIGPMELKSGELADSLQKLLVVDKIVVVVVHQKLKHPLIEQFKRKSSFTINIDLEKS